ncbi:MAG: chloride channel protein [Finegoldia sp.]|nr:chloride channel protein [Finegoldia sp.]
MKEKTSKREKIILYLKEILLLSLASSFIVICYRLLIDNSINKIYKIFPGIGFIKIALCLVSFIILTFLVDKITKKVSAAAGSGVTNAIEEYEGLADQDPLSLIPARFLGGFVSAFVGLPLSKAGPSIHMSAISSKLVGKFLKVDVEEGKKLMRIAGGLGLCAAFSAPLSGIFFSIENFKGKLQKSYLFILVLSSFITSLLTKAFLGSKPFLIVEVYRPLDLKIIAYIGIFSLMGILSGFIFSKTCNFMKKRVNKGWLSIFIAMAISLTYSLALDFYMGDTKLFSQSLMDKKFSTLGLAVIAILFLILLGLSYASGAPGGTTVPIIITGLLGAYLLFDLLAGFKLIGREYFSYIMVLAMAATFSTVFRTPLCASFLAIELTGAYPILFDCLAVSFIAYYLAGLIQEQSFFYKTVTDKRKLQGLGLKD